MDIPRIIKNRYEKLKAFCFKVGANFVTAPYYDMYIDGWIFMIGILTLDSNEFIQVRPISLNIKLTTMRYNEIRKYIKNMKGDEKN